jgi:hypothetical protein
MGVWRRAYAESSAVERSLLLGVAAIWVGPCNIYTCNIYTHYSRPALYLDRCNLITQVERYMSHANKQSISVRKALFGFRG